MLATNNPHQTARNTVERDFDRYRDVVAGILAHHHRTSAKDGRGEAVCACGGVWPCRDEMLAAELLDWI